MDCAQLVFVGSRDAIASHRHQSDVLRRMFAYRLNRRLRRNERARMELGGVSRRHDPLRASASALDDCQALDMSSRSLKRRVSEVKARRSTTTDLPHAKLADASAAQCQCLLDVAYHNDFCGSASKYHGRGREGSEHVDYHNRSGSAFGSGY